MKTVFSRKFIPMRIMLISLIVVFSLLGCTKDNAFISPPNSSSTVSELTNSQSVEDIENKNQENILLDIYDTKLAKGKLAIWFFTLPGEEHTGESILIRTPNEKTILVDSGTIEVGEQVVEYLNKLGVEKIDNAIATHMHQDHIGGFPSIVKEIPISNFYTSTYVNYDTSTTKDFLTSAKDKQIPINSVKVGQIVEIDKDLNIEFMNPDIATAPPDIDSGSVTADFLNDSSVVFKLTYKGNSVLFTGDIHNYSENILVERYGDKLKSDVIKIPHHGSNTSSSKSFIETVGAKNSIMCIYAFNDFNVYKRYETIGKRPYVTSIDGTVLMLSDGGKIDFFVEKERKGIFK